MKKNVCALLVIILTCLSFQSYAQDNPDNNETKKEKRVRPFRIGAKVGFPNLVGGNVEYVTPLPGKKLALNFDYSRINSGWLEIEERGYSAEPGYENDYSENSELDFTYIEGGLHYYFFRPGRGLYGGVSYGMIKIEGTVEGIEDENNYGRTGTGRVDYVHNSMNVKLGAKLGGLFYFRPEIGYSFTPLPKSFDMSVEFDDGERRTQTESFDIEEGSAAAYIFRGFMVNIGIGFAF